MKNHSFVYIDYDECDPLSYRGIGVKYNETEQKFNTGDFVRDWFNFQIFEFPENLISHVFSSSYDHFFMDKAKFRQCWFNGSKLIYKVTEDEYAALTNFYTPKGSNWSWKQLKEYCMET